MSYIRNKYRMHSQSHAYQSAYSYYRNPRRRKPRPNYGYISDISDGFDNSAREMSREVKRRFGRRSEYLLLGVLGLFIILFLGKHSAFLLFAAITAIVKYVQTKSLWAINVSPLFFFTVLVGTQSLWAALLFLIVADLIPYVCGGGVISFEGFPKYMLFMFWAWIATLTPHTIAATGVVLSVLNAFGVAGIKRYFSGGFERLTIFNVVLPMMLNVFYFVKLGPYFVSYFL